MIMTTVETYQNPLRLKRKHPFFGKMRYLFRIVSIYRNWWTVLRSQYVRDDDLSLLVLRDGTRYTVRNNKSDTAMLNEVVIMQVYAWLMRRMDETSIVLDGGSQSGDFSVVAGRRAHSVIAIEPNAANAQLTQLNFTQNRLKHANVIRAALGAKEGRASLYASESAAGHSIMGRVGKKASETSVKVTTLASIMRTHSLDRIDCLKLNIEGAEEEVIKSAPLNKIHFIMMEVHPHVMDVSALERTLRSHGFQTKRDEEYLVAENVNYPKNRVTKK